MTEGVHLDTGLWIDRPDAAVTRFDDEQMRRHGLERRLFAAQVLIRGFDNPMRGSVRGGPVS